MFFLDALNEYLQSLLQPGARPDDSAPSSIEPAAVRLHLVRCLERLEQAAQAQGPESFQERVRQNEIQLDIWHRDDAVVRFAQHLEQLLRHSIGRDASNTDLAAWVETGLARRLGLPDSLSTQIRTQELDRLAGAAADDVFNARYVSTADIRGYANAIRATLKVGSATELTPIGRVFQELTGRDAIRWLLHVEAAQATGYADHWRLSRDTARLLLEESPWVLAWIKSPTAISDFNLAWPTLHRLHALGLMSIQDDFLSSQTTLNLLPLGRELLTEIARGEESPMSLLASSLLDDLTHSTVHSAGAPHPRESPSTHFSGATEATARQARLVAHEIRNVLVPVKTALSALYREVLLAPPSEAVSRRRESIDRGIDAVFRFVEQLVKVSALGATPPEPFDPMVAIRDAVSAIQEETGLQVAVVLPQDLPPVTGHRDRFVLALSNVLRNATQAVSQHDPRIQFQAASIENSRAVLITIDDNGPGVPANMRQAIFNEGVSLRPGGSGLGLALVREVFEKEMKGLVSCDASPLGGARFVLRVPTTGLERP